MQRNLVFYVVTSVKKIITIAFNQQLQYFKS